MQTYKSKQLALIEKTFLKKRFQRKIINYAQLQLDSWSPDITISRAPGSGGRLVAKRLAKKIGWDFYDKILLKKIAQKLDYPSSFLEKIDEHPRSKITDLFHALFNPNYLSDYTYIKHLKKIILETAKERNVVILGRGANHIIPQDKALNVRITAPFNIRLANTIKYEKLSREEAIKHLKNVETNRNQFLQQYFGANATTAENFDLVINTANLSLDSAVELIIKAFKEKFPRYQKLIK